MLAYPVLRALETSGGRKAFYRKRKKVAAGSLCGKYIIMPQGILCTLIVRSFH